MNSRKIQIWFRPDQIDLLRSILAAGQLDIENAGIGKLERALLRFCGRRIAELIRLLPKKEETARIEVVGTPTVINRR